MNTPETINIEKYAEALNNLVGMDIGYLGNRDENVNAIVEVIRAAKALEDRVKELEAEKERIRSVYSHICVEGVLTQEDMEKLRIAHTEHGQHGDPVGESGECGVVYGRWIDNHCTACGMTPMGEEMWTRFDLTPPRFEWFMDFCPCCGVVMLKGDKK